jgi:hypothetical protein
MCIAGVTDLQQLCRNRCRRFLSEVAVKNVRGFEVGLDRTTKAHLLGYWVDEEPRRWEGRATGECTFDLVGWLQRCRGRKRLPSGVLAQRLTRCMARASVTSTR